MKAKEISKRDYCSSGLLASGFKVEDVTALTQFLDAPAESLPILDELVHINQLKMAEALSLHGIVSNLRRLTQSSDHQAAVSAVELLMHLSQHLGILSFKVNPDLDAAHTDGQGEEDGQISD
ncbi:hypothetical protein [Serratia marcescens]|uniref:hypothetical protein n=1 Tax=Serratia marcescens TaxID=615 RepID=UPI0037D7407D